VDGKADRDYDVKTDSKKIWHVYSTFEPMRVGAGNGRADLLSASLLQRDTRATFHSLDI
jgi:hypothetical protein